MTRSKLSRSLLPGEASRREFLRRASAFSLLGGAGPLAMNLATLGSAAAAAADYKALVCVFLYGGNDAYNMVLATDTDSWTAYTTTRNQQPDPISLMSAGTLADSAKAAGSPARLGGVLPIHPTNAQGRLFALHPMLTKVQGLFEDGRVGIVANVGPLVRPTTKTDFASAAFPKPSKLFSHNDQQSTWQSFAPEGSTAGWGGRFADAFLGSNGANSLFTAVSATGNAVWLSGRDALQYQIASSGLISIGDRKNAMFASSPTSGASGPVLGSDKSVYATMTRLMRQPAGSDVLGRDYAAVGTRALDAEILLKANLPDQNIEPWGTPGTAAGAVDIKLKYTSPLTGELAANPLAQQFQAVARMIQAGKAMGLSRQVFMVSLGGFDTHDNQNRTQADLMAKLDHGLDYFNTVVGGSSEVTTFTASDFGRTFTSNGDGTDHGWGSHHFVMGGAVTGKDIYGAFPTYSVADLKTGDFSSANQLRNGALLPNVSVDQYAYTLARWFGVSDSYLMGSGGILPNIGNFSGPNLGFLT